MDNHSLAALLVNEYPAKAVEIIARFCQHDANKIELLSYINQSPKGGHNSASSTPKGLNIHLNSPLATSPEISQYSGSPPPRPRPLQRATSSVHTGPFGPLSPPKTASSVTSHSSAGSHGSSEYILFLVQDALNIKEIPIRMKKAPIKYSLIREDIVHDRKIFASLDPVTGFIELGPRSAGVQVSYCATIVWRRPTSEGTHQTIFYVVPNDKLDIDVVLGYADSGEGPARMSPLPSQRPTYVQPDDSMVRPPAPTPPAPAASFHRSAVVYNDASIAVANSFQPSPFQRQHQFVDNLLARQQMRCNAQVESVHSSPSPVATVLGSRGVPHIEQPQPLRHSSGHASPVRHMDHSPALEKIRLSFTWDVTPPMNMWLDPSAPGEQFYQAFQSLAERRSFGRFRRNQLTIYLKQDKASPENEAYALSLDQDELEADWDTTVTWIRENQREKPPRIYGRVQVGEG